jgi:subtilisin-like proprotein convertase family protein
MYFFNKISKVYILIGLIIFLGLISLHQFTKIDFTQSEKRMGSYSFYKDGNSIATRNLSNGFNIAFGTGSFEISSLKGKNAYNLHYQLKDIEVSEKVLGLSNKPKYVALESKLKESHKDFSINYTNSQKGLRQDFVINEGPTDNVDIKVNLELSTNLIAKESDQFSIVMTDSINKAINIYYKDLIVYDAKGKFLKSEMLLNEMKEGKYQVTLAASGMDITYPVTIDPLSTSGWYFESAVDSTFTGYSVIGSCDLNGDGYCDAVVSSYGHQIDMIDNVGKIDVFYGSASGFNLAGIPNFTALGDTIVNKPNFRGLASGSQFGYSVSCGKDINNDGFEDVIVGAPRQSMIDTTGGGNDTLFSVGAVYIYYGSSTGLSNVNRTVIYGTQENMSLGFAVAGIGDINSDSYDDILASGPGFSNTLTRQGVVYVFKGSAGGLVNAPFASLFGTVENEQYGTALAGVGDLNNDTFEDFLIGAHHFTMGTDTAIGRVHLFHGNAVAINATPMWQANGPHKGAQFGFSLAGIGDFSGDTRKDVIIGCNRYNPDGLIDTSIVYGNGNGIGGAFVYTGNGTTLSTSPATVLLNDVGASGFGSSVANAGDVDGDGKQDVLVGAPFYSGGNNNTGAIYGFYGKSYETGIDSTADWFVQGELPNAFLGISAAQLGGCTNDGNVNSVIVGAYGYGPDTLFRGGAFGFKGKLNCGLPKYLKPVFLTFPENDIIDADPGMCSKKYSFNYPLVDDNCPGASVQVITAIDSGGVFPVGINTVTFRITNSEGVTSDSSFTIEVVDNEAPVVTSCPETVSILLGIGVKSGVLNYTVPTFNDNCGSGGLTVNRISGPASGTIQNVGVYPVTYEAIDQAGNVSFCSFRVILRDVNADGKTCEDQIIRDTVRNLKETLSPANFEWRDKLSNRITTSGAKFGVDLLISLFEQVSGLSIPGWVKKGLGQLGTNIDLAFVKVEFNFLPTLDIDYGAYYDFEKDENLVAEVDYISQVCTNAPADRFFGCRDTISLTTSLEVDRLSSSLKVAPGVVKQEFGLFVQNFQFRWRISIKISACIGIPLCIPFVGCAGCLGYRDSWGPYGVDVFEPINLFATRQNLPVLTVCEKAFRPGANIGTVFDCFGLGSGANKFFTEMNALVGGQIPFDPFFYDPVNDQFRFSPNRLPKIGNKIPEMELFFGRLTKNEMSPTSIRGDALYTSGKENNFFRARLDIFSLLPYFIPEDAKNSLLCLGIEIGTQSIDFGVPTKIPGTTQCEVSFLKKFLKLDVMDLNVSLRSCLVAEYEFDADVKIDNLDLGQPTNWNRPQVAVSGNSQNIPNISLDETIEILIPDDQTDLMTLDYNFSANGTFKGKQTVRDNLDFGIVLFEFLPSILISKGIGPLLKKDPLLSIPFNTRSLRDYSDNFMLDGFSGRVFLQPDDIPPVVFCKDTTVILNDDGFAFLDARTAFDSIRSFDLPIGGTGKLNVIDVFPDTIFCSDYPSTFGYLVVEDDNCNFDTCQFTVTVLDTLRPRMGCVDIVVGIGENGTYFLNPDEVAIGVTDNCLNLTAVATPNIFTCDDVGFARPVNILVTDIAGNTNSCTATVTVVDTMALLLECPYLFNYPTYRKTIPGACVYIPDNQEFRPRLVAPDCNTIITYQLTGATTGTGSSNVGGILFNLGETTITYTATDASGNVTTCSFRVIVEDAESPMITCPSNITIGTNHDLLNNYDCATNFTWQHPRPADNCSIIRYNVTYTNPDGTSQTINLQPRYLANNLSETRNFPLGKTNIQYVAIDTMNNSVACSFTVNVIDDERPTLFCGDVVSCQPYIYEGSMDIRPNDITTFALNVPNNINITDLNVSLAGSALNLGQLTFALRSPGGTIVPLFGSLCNNTTTFNLNLDDAAANSSGGAPCNPLGNGGTFRPAGLLSNFNGQMSMGTWQLLVTNTHPASCGTLTNFTLNICGNSIDLLFNTKVSILANEGECDFTVLTKEFDPNFTDNCAGTKLTHNYIFGPFNNTLQGAVLPLGSTSVIWTATDAAGNISICTIIYEVKDRNKPVFINCPEPDVIQDAEPNTCGAYVNFALPLAFDDCGGQITVEQIDDTGLATGSIFPVGMTILTYRAVDASGNSSTCSVRVIVNDTQNGSFTCPQNAIRSTDPWLCSAVVNGIAPSNIIDNCSQNATITYQIEHPTNSGNIVGGGVRNASGDTFQKGNSTVTYKMSSQPSLLITEVTQEIAAPIGGMSPIPYTVLTTDDYMEVTNFGPAAYNVSGLIVERFGAGFSDVFEIPNKTIIQPGRTLVIHFGNGEDIPADNFYNVPCASDLISSQAAGYMISFKGRILDIVTTNNYNPVGNSITATITGLDWFGTTGNASDRAGIIRKFSFDNNVGKDWVIADNCYPLTIGILNPELDVYPPNGATTALQSIMPQMQTCQFIVTVNDLEAPFCAETSDINTFNGTPVAGGFDSCNEGVVTIPLANDCIVGDINVTVNGTIFGVDNIFMTLTSPSGQKVNLVNNPCPGTVDGNVTLNSTFDDEANNFITTACGNTSWSGSFRPQQALLEFYGTKAAGEWTLTIGGTGLSNSTVNITSWTLNVTCLTPFQMDDVVINSEPGLCNSKYSWIHPYFLDNCKNGSISVEYTTSNAACVPIGNILPVFGGQNVTQTFCVGTTKVTYTLVDSESNTQQCSFNVTVLDNEAPKLFPNACTDYAIQLNPSECERVINFNLNPLLIGTDNCGIESVVYSPASGTAFPIGITVVNLTITDKAGNKTTCNFDVVISEYLPTSGTFACNDLINLSLNENCNATINTDMILEGNEYRCLENYCINITTLGGLPHNNYFDLSDIGQTFIVSISDCLGGNNSCWGYVKIEEKLVPIIECPSDKTVYCGANITPDSTGYALLKSCEPFAKIYHEDYVETFGLCNSPRSIITREWYIDDNQGNISNCTQKITVLPISLDNIVWPKDIEVDQALECADVIKVPTLTEPDSTGYPTINGMKLLLGNQCMVSIIKEDEIFPLCGGSYVIARTWKILNACQPLTASNPRVHVQAIKVFDTEKPIIYPCPDNMTVSTSPWACFADSIDLPIPETLKDPCSNISLSVKVFGGGRSLVRGTFKENNLSIKALNLSKGDHLVRYSATDECGNVAHCNFTVTVIDASAPIAVAKQNIVLSLAGDAAGNGSAKLYGWQIDNGSYDHCTQVRFEVRRPSGGSCDNVGANGTHNNNSTYNDNTGFTTEVPGRVWFHPNDNAQDNDGGEFVKFCCEDIPSGSDFGLHEVELRVWDDGNMNGIYGDNEIINGQKDNYNTTWVSVRVENKLTPVIVCPPDVTVTCDMELNLSLDKDTSVDSVDLSMTGIANAYDLCSGLSVTYRDAWIGANNPICKNGVVRRTFKVTKGAIVVTCSQLITVTAITIPFTVTFPQNAGTTEWSSCSFSLDDARDASNPAIKKPIVNYGQCDIVGENIKIDTFLFEDGACKKWRVEYSYKNWCTNEDRGPFVHYYTYKDDIAPVLTCTNQMFAANPNPANPNGGCEASVILEASATDALVCADESWVKWQMFFDGWADGTVDRLASSFVNKSWNGIWVPQARLIAGQPNPTWIALQSQHPNTPLADLVYVTYIKPSKASGETVKLPAFILDAENISHKVLWKVTDGCGNVDQCESSVMVVDKKAPTPYCVSVNTAVMQTTPKMVELWAKDFDKGSFDNCSPQTKLYYTFDELAPLFNRINDEHFYKAGPNGTVINATAAEYAAGNAYKWLPSIQSAGKIWTSCGDYTVRVSVWDEAWNTDYCSSNLNIIGCSGSIISGQVATALGNRVPNVTVVANSALPEYPKSILTDINGKYEYNLQTGLNYELQATKNGDYINGVTTLDLVLIQRHILGLEVFTDPYKVIAADATNDGRITAADLVEIRKLILGITTSFKNASWRFPVKGQALSVSSPFPYIDNYNYLKLEKDNTSQDFVAVKIGDINSSATINLNKELIEKRNQNTLTFILENRFIDAGQTIALPVTSDNFNDIFGYQMTFNLKNARLERMESGILEVTENNLGVFEDGKITMSYASIEPLKLASDEILFTLHITSKVSGTLRDIISLSSEITPAESYGSDLSVGKVDLVFLDESGDNVVLYQNEPNPFIGQTSITFKLPEASQAFLTIHDVTGKQLKSVKIDGVKGLNTVSFSKAELGVSGVLYYTLESGSFTSTKKMIIVE